MNIFLTGANAPGHESIMRCLEAARYSVTGFEISCEGRAGLLAGKPAQMCSWPNDDSVIMPIRTNDIVPCKIGFGDRCVSEKAEKVELVNNKRALYTRFDSISPEIISYDEAKEEAGRPHCHAPNGNPVCLRSATGNGGRGFFKVVYNPDHMKRWPVEISIETAKEILLRDSNMFLCRFIKGTEYTVDAIFDHGVPWLIVPRRRDEIKYGITFRGAIEQCKPVIELVERVGRELNWHGFMGLQAIYENRYGISSLGEPGGKTTLIEINPRMQGGTAGCMAAGVNFPDLAVRIHINDLPAEKPKVKWGATFYRENKIVW